MAYILYVLFAGAAVLVAGWAVYVAPTPGPLPVWVLAVALLPSFGIVLAVVLTITVLGLALRLCEAVLARVFAAARARRGMPKAS